MFIEHAACLVTKAPTMDAAPPIVLYLAPEGRHVYSTRHANNQSPYDGYRAANCAAFSPRGAACL